MLGVCPLVFERGRRLRCLKGSSFLLERVEEGIELAGDVAPFEMHVQVLLEVEVGRGQGCHLVNGTAIDWDELIESGFIVDLAFDFVGGSASDA